MRGFYFVLAASVLAGSAMIECSSDQPTCDGGSCVDSGVPTVSGGGCDSSKPASQGGCAVDDSDGFFVSPTGLDTNAGTKIAPFKTIQAGITAASASVKQPNVYVCAGSYPENLTIKNAPAGVALHGGFDCASWTQSSATTTTVAPTWVTNATKPQYVLAVDATAVLVEGLTLTGPDALDPSASTVTVMITASPGATFRRATVTSGKAADGASPTPPTPAAAAADGNVAAFDTLAPAKICPCGSETTIGGQGGGTDGGATIQNAEAGAPVINGNTAAGQPGIAYGTTTAICSGGNGADGLVGSTGAATSSVGELTANGWTTTSGGSGGAGGTAQGGGGGSYPAPGQTICGGSGGCGGCGGQGGVGGSTGGASIAIGAIASTLRIQSSSVRAGDGGAGGNGSAGQGGQPGGAGGTSQQCIGGKGGTGGNGGSGGGGAGGTSVAIATHGTVPDIDQQSTTLAGTAGKGGQDATAAHTKAVDGVAAVVHEF